MRRKAAQNKPLRKAYLGIGRAPVKGSETWGHEWQKNDVSLEERC